MDIILEAIAALRECGVKLDSNIEKEVSARLRGKFGGRRLYEFGELHYVPKLPKQVRAMKVSEAQKTLGTAAITLKRMSQATGIPTRTIQRLRNGR